MHMFLDRLSLSNPFARFREPHSAVAHRVSRRRIRQGYSAIIAAAVLLAWWSPAPARAEPLDQLFRITAGRSDTAGQYRTFEIPAGRQETLADLQGPGKVTYFYFTDDSGGKIYDGLVLEVFWDGAGQPSIRVPLADFFGAIGGRTIDYQSQPMPFAKSARFVLVNDGLKGYRQSVAYSIDWEKDPVYATPSSRLHACWRRSNPTQGMHTILETRGRGHYVGNFLQVYTRYKGWWGEGDTIFQVDGKPITHTPGTEDEYGSCWGFGGTFASACCGYLENREGHHRMYRWYLANPVRFQESLKVEIQNQRYEKGQVPSSDDYVSVAFWYLDKATAVPLQPYAERTAASKAREYGK
jgi:hypothetical protein